MGLTHHMFSHSSGVNACNLANILHPEDSLGSVALSFSAHPPFNFFVFLFVTKLFSRVLGLDRWERGPSISYNNKCLRSKLLSASYMLLVRLLFFSHKLTSAYK